MIWFNCLIEFIIKCFFLYQGITSRERKIGSRKKNKKRITKRLNPQSDFIKNERFIFPDEFTEKNLRINET